MIVPVLVSLACTVNAQDITPVLELLGAAEEEMNPYDVERLEDLLEHPLRLNHVSAAALEESGLFTRYQVASLTDYRDRHGDVLSFGELAALDGFGRDFVSRAAPFISLESGRLPGQPQGKRIRNDISLRTGIRYGGSMTYGLKYRLESGERLSGGLSLSRTSSARTLSPDAFSGHLAFHSRRGGKILLGDFNARFGQGLALWNGMSFSGLTSAASFMRKSSGISASSSFTGQYSLRGLAGYVRIGHAGLSLLTAFREGKDALSVMPAVNLSWFLRNSRMSLTHYADFALYGDCAGIPDMKTAADFSCCIRGTDLFAEVALDWDALTAAALGGFSCGIGDDVRLAAMLRCYPSDFSSERSAAARSTTKCTNEYAFSSAVDFSAGRWISVNGVSGFGSSVRRHAGKASVDFAYFPAGKSADLRESIQVKAQTEWKCMVSNAFRMTLRFSERVRTWGEPFRTDIRADIAFLSEHMKANLRVNLLKCAGIGFLTYQECGWTSDAVSVFVRMGLFHIDNWADRIYVYERDAPGSFNVPAYYGRGMWTALTLNWKFARWGRMYVRGAVTAYPFLDEKKPGRAELKVHLVFRL